MQQLLRRLVLPLAQRASGLALFYEMLEVIDKSKKERQFAYTFLFLAFIFGMGWIMPDFLKALSYFILTLKNG